MINPIMAKLASDMRTAADHLENFSKMYDAIDSTEYPWTAAELRHEADVLEKS